MIFQWIKINQKKQSKKLSSSYKIEKEVIGSRLWNNDNIDIIRCDSSKSYKLLDLLSKDRKHALDDFTREIYKNYKNIDSKVKERNNSILAHGLKPICEEDARRLNDLVIKHATKYCDNIEREMEKAKFPKF